MYESVYGFWSVTTEGDVEGRTTRHLGTFEGYVDEIALHLADQCYYSLTFKKIKPVTNFVPSRNDVDVTFDIDSGTWNTPNKELAKQMKKFFSNRPVHILPSNYFASFKISLDDPKSEEEKAREQALAKLTEDEKKILGLKG